MTRYFLRRLLLIIPTLMGISLLVFFIVRALPGDVVEILIGQFTAGNLSEEERAKAEAELGLDDCPTLQGVVDIGRNLPKCLAVGYPKFVGGLFKLDLGTDFRSRLPITEDLQDRLPVSFQLGLMAILFSLIISLPIGVLAAIRQDSWADYIARSTAIGFLALPAFWLATLIIVLPNRWWNWAPPFPFQYFWDDPVQNLYFLSIPAGILGIGLSGSVMRLTRAQMLEVLRQDYIRTAWAKGLQERSVILRHALKNAFIPVVTLIGLQIPIVIGGAVVVETVFSIPGMGFYLVQAIGNRNYPVVQAVNLLVAMVVVFSNLIVDMTYAYLDPRIRYA